LKKRQRRLPELERLEAAARFADGDDTGALCAAVVSRRPCPGHGKIHANLPQLPELDTFEGT